MGLTSLQVSTDLTEWLQGVIQEEKRMDSSSSSLSGDMIPCSRSLLEKRLMRPQIDQALKCPRCDSTRTKFCYYNNYSLTQPRYFCKACRRYWTKGGSLRNIPVGGGCRKNKKTYTKKSSINQHQNSTSHDFTDLQFSIPQVQFSHLYTLMGTSGNLENQSNFMGISKYSALMENNPISVDFTMLENPRNHDFMGNNEMGFVGSLEDVSNGFAIANSQGFPSPFGVSFDIGNNGSFMDNYQRLKLPIEECEDPNTIEIKPNNKLLSLECQDQGCSEMGKDSFNGIGWWNGVINNGYGSSARNPLI